MISAKNAAHFPRGWLVLSLRSGVLVGIVAALVFPASAFAHANLDGTSPNYRQRLQSAPRAVVLHFDQSVQAEPNAIVVKNEFGKTLSATASAHGQTVKVPLERLPRGAYTVRWHVLSEDGHVVSGVFTFGVRVKAPPPTEAYGASGPTTAEHVVRWAYFLSLALLLGGLGFRLLLGRDDLPPAAQRRFFAVVGAGAVATLEVGILAFMLRAEDARRLPLGRFRRRRGLFVALRARRLGASLGGSALDRRTRAARLRRLAQGARASADGFPALLAAGLRVDRDRARRRLLPEHRAAPAAQRPMDRWLWARAARQARARLARADLGRGAPLRRASGA